MQSAKQTVSMAALLLLLVVSEDAVEQPSAGDGGGKLQNTDFCVQLLALDAHSHSP